MNLSRIGGLAATAAALAVLAVPGLASAQDCEGSKPKGGMWPTSAELYLTRARQNPYPDEKRSLFNQALEVAVDGFAKQSDNPRNYELAGQAYVGLNDLAGADSVFRKAVELWSCYAGRIDTLRFNAWAIAFNRGIQYSQSGDEEKAIAEYKSAWTIYDEMPQPMLQIGQIYARRAAVAETPEDQTAAQEEALAAFRMALTVIEERGARLTPEQRQEYSRAAAFNLAQMLAFEGKYLEAAAEYDRFLAMDPDNVDAVTNAAVVLTRASQEFKQQAADVEEGAEKDSLLAEGAALSERAAGYYSDLLAREDLSAGEYYNIGLGLTQLQEYGRASTSFQRAAEKAPYNERILAQLAFVLFSEAMYDSLAVVAKKLVDNYPLNLNNMALLANAYRELDNSEGALAILERRETLKMELVDLALEGGEGEFKLVGALHNIALEPGSTVDVEFHFHDATGARVSSQAVTLEAPEQGTDASFSVDTTSSETIVGFSYNLLESAAQTAN
ncbi:MAG: hypothetical protein JSU87_16680 [Gemmatimonadota bacterium]|nr:MAG: hypothetical protein JSU87_16680 [Gemmatimonadota bacterium]